MPMTPAARELVLDSEATLRLADAAAADAAGVANGADGPDAEPMPLEALPDLVMLVYREIDAIVGRLRESRGALRRAAVEQLHHTTEKLRLVTSATEVAATDIMDSVDRALALVDRLETRDGADTSEEAFAVRGGIRDELFSVMTHLQFQDITTQQINHASAMLTEVEDRLAVLTQIFDPRTLGLAAAEETSRDISSYDPLASTNDRETRQALVDEILQSPPP